MFDRTCTEFIKNQKSDGEVEIVSVMWWPSTLLDAKSGQVETSAAEVNASPVGETNDQYECGNGGSTEVTARQDEGIRDPFPLIWEGMSELGSRDGQGARSFSHELKVGRR